MSWSLMPVDELGHRTACEEGMGSLKEVLPSPGSLCSPHQRPMNPSNEVLRQGRDFNQGAGRPRR